MCRIGIAFWREALDNRMSRVSKSNTVSMEIHEGEALQNAAKMSPLGIHGLAESMKVPRSTLYYNFRKRQLDPLFKEAAARALNLTPELLFGGRFNLQVSDSPGAAPSPGEAMRLRKALGLSPKREKGIGLVPIGAQAGYSRHYQDPLFVNELEEMRIPHLPFQGEQYRVFEVSGDSMEPTLKEHFHVVAERVDPEYWNSTAQFYIYVIVTLDRIMVKRLFRKSDQEFVLISDNEEFYPQFVLPQKEIRELWLVKRKIDWEMPPPKKFDIKV